MGQPYRRYGGCMRKSGSDPDRITGYLFDIYLLDEEATVNAFWRRPQCCRSIR